MSLNAYAVIAVYKIGVAVLILHSTEPDKRSRVGQVRSIGNDARVGIFRLFRFRNTQPMQQRFGDRQLRDRGAQVTVNWRFAPVIKRTRRKVEAKWCDYVSERSHSTRRSALKSGVSLSLWEVSAI